MARDEEGNKRKSNISKSTEGQERKKKTQSANVSTSIDISISGTQQDMTFQKQSWICLP